MFDVLGRSRQRWQSLGRGLQDLMMTLPLARLNCILASSTTHVFPAPPLTRLPGPSHTGIRYRFESPVSDAPSGRRRSRPICSLVRPGCGSTFGTIGSTEGRCGRTRCLAATYDPSALRSRGQGSEPGRPG